MNVELQVVRSAFYFVEGIALSKAEGKKVINFLDITEDAILNIIASIKVGDLSSSVEAFELGSLLKSQDKKDAFNYMFNIVSDGTQEAEVVDVVEVVAEVVEVVDEQKSAEEEEKEYLESLKALLEGNVKTVIEALSNAALNDEDKIFLIDEEQKDKNRKSVITAISEL